jgi:hypothetical protein
MPWLGCRGGYLDARRSVCNFCVSALDITEPVLHGYYVFNTKPGSLATSIVAVPRNRDDDRQAASRYTRAGFQQSSRPVRVEPRPIVQELETRESQRPWASRARALTLDGPFARGL